MSRQYGLRWYLLCLWLFVAPLQAANDRVFYWQVSHGESTLFLLGSIHFADSSFYPLRRIIESDFQQADTLVVELDISRIKPQQYQGFIREHGHYPPGDSLRQHLPPASWQRLQALLAGLHIPLEQIVSKKPGLVVMELTATLLEQLGYQAALGIDLHFIRQAVALGKPVIGLETLQQQLRLLADLPEASILLQASLDEFDQAEAQLRQLEQAWKRGDDAALLQLMVAQPEAEYPGYRQVNEAILYGRNDSMVERLRELLSSGGRHFVVVGAAHLLGPRGIVGQLQAAGYRVQRR